MYSKQRQMQYRHLQKCFVQSIPRDLGFLPRTATGRSPDLSSSLTAAPFKPSRISPVAYIKSSRNTVTRSCRTCTCFPFHLHGQRACRHHPLYLLCYNTTSVKKEKQSLRLGPRSGRLSCSLHLSVLLYAHSFPLPLPF